MIMKRKHFLWTVLILLAWAMPTHAVLKEKSLSETLSNLRVELQQAMREKFLENERYQQDLGSMRQNIHTSMRHCNQIALMLYSQKMENTFDMAYACSQAIDLYEEIRTYNMPFVKLEQWMQFEKERYELLLRDLTNISDSLLENEVEVADRNESIRAIESILSIHQQQWDILTGISTEYRTTLQRLKEMDAYAHIRYEEIREAVFVTGEYTYPQVITYFSYLWQTASEALVNKYIPLGGVKSEWRGPVLMFLIIVVGFYLFIASGLSLLVIGKIVPKRIRDGEEFKQKRTCLTLACAVGTFSLVMLMLRLFFFHHNFLIMASELLIEYGALATAILVSLLIRIKGSVIGKAYRLYMPIMVLGIIVITLRIFFVPNDIINIGFPPLIILFSIWQLISIKRNIRSVPQSDTFYAWISAVIMVSTSVLSWSGYVLLSVQILIWWLFQITFIQAVTCFYHLFDIYERRYVHKLIERAGGNAEGKKRGYYIKQTWLFDFITMCLTPILAVLSFALSLFLAAHVFNLTDWVEILFVTKFVDAESIAVISLLNLTLVACLFFVFKYLNYLFHNLYIHHDRRREGERKIQITLGRNLIVLGVWGTYIIVSLSIFSVSKSGIAVIAAGLSTGVGFALKDLIENFFYGMSLMTGRVRVGDIIECDGIRGKVERISYQSTQVLTLDDTVMSLLNSQLFSKNFKNLTRNNPYEKVYIPVGVAYGTKVDMVRSQLKSYLEKRLYGVKGKSGMDLLDKKKGILVLMNNFGDSSVDLVVLIWMLVEDQPIWVGKAREAVYEALNEHKVQIPFPQQDVYLHVGESLQHPPTA